MNARIAIVSLFDYLNYGNSLQRYSVQQALKKRGFQPVSFSVRTHPMLSSVKFALMGPRADVKKSRNFKSFAKRAGIVTQTCKPQKLIEIIRKGFSAAIIGSDQVWNPFFELGSRKDGLAFLEGISADRKIALSPSFGISQLPEEWTSLYAKWLSDFGRVSVRELDGACIVKTLTGEDATVLIDPTMTVEADEWRALADYSVCPQERYVLTYYLGDNTAMLDELVRSFASAHGWRIINLMDKTSEGYLIAPDGFIALIDGAELVVTDSFHGTVFSILMHTDFAMVERVQENMCDMVSRMNTLASKFDCGDRFVSADAPELPVSSLDWDAVDFRLTVEREVFCQYLDAELLRCGLVS